MTQPTKLTRRTFLKKSMAAGATAAAFPYIIPSSALGADGNVAPSNRIALGFIGLGKQGRDSHIASHRGNPEVQIVALCDVETIVLERSKKMVEDAYAKRKDSGSYKGIDLLHDFRELCARPDIDAVVIATPDHWHAMPCIEAAKNGKDIYCEKPLTRTIQEGRAIVDAVRRHGRIFQTGSQQRSEYGGMFRRAAELVRNGVIGDIKSIDIGIGGFPTDSYDLLPEPTPPTLDWNFWLGPAPWRPYSATLCPINYDSYPAWRYYSDYAGGGFSDFGAHHFDIAQWALDMDNSGPVEIIPPDPNGEKRMTFVYANGIPMYHGGQADCVFHGTEGTIFVSREFLRSDPPEILNYALKPSDIRLGRGRDHREDWLHCIRTRELPIADVEIGHRTSTVCQLGNICNVVKRRLKWDPVSEQFENDDEANRLLTRPMRSPWKLQTKQAPGVRGICGRTE